MYRSRKIMLYIHNKLESILATYIDTYIRAGEFVKLNSL